MFSFGEASAELDYTFLAFEDVYKSVLSFVPKGKTIIDLGCAYAPQAFYFTEYKGYIGVDICIPEVHFETPNMKIYNISIQEFCEKVKKDGRVSCVFELDGGKIAAIGIATGKLGVTVYVNDSIREDVEKLLKDGEITKQ